MIRLPESIFRALADGATLIVPSRQRAHAIRLAFAATRLAEGAQVWRSPDVLPYDAWLLRTLERSARNRDRGGPRVLAPAEEWLLWSRCARTASSELQLLHPDALVDALQHSASLACDLGLRIEALPTLEASEFHVFRAAWGDFLQRCRELDAASARSLELQSDSPVYCSGFLQRPRELADALTLPEPPPEGDADAATGAAAGDPTPGLPRVALAPTVQDEAEQIALWCHTKLLEKADARLLVVLPGSEGARERLATLIRQVLLPREWLAGGTETGAVAAVSIEGGGSLADLPAVSHALLTLQLLTGTDVEFVRLSEWLRAPWWVNPAGWARLDLWLRESDLAHGSSPEWLVRLRNGPANILPAVRELDRLLSGALERLGGGGRSSGSPRDWSERFRAALEALGWPGERLRGSHEQQILVRFHELLDEFGQLSAVLPALGARDAVQMLNRLARRTVFRPADEDAAVTISGAWADPITLYDGIWVAGLHADSFPRPVQPDPFIPLAAQVQAGSLAASATGRFREAHALLRAWRRTTGDLILSAPQRDDDLELLPSPLLAPWRDRAYRAELTGFAGGGPLWLAMRLHRQGVLEHRADESGVAWPAGQAIPGGTRALELQNLCAFRAYAEMRLGSSRLGEPEQGVRADVRGRLLHAALQKLWQILKDSTALQAYGPEALQPVVMAAVDAAAREMLDVDAILQPPMVRERLRAARLIGKLCELEKQRADFTVVGTEQQISAVFAGSAVNMRIDRVDRLADGCHAILDYKSGQGQSADWYGERPSHPQLLAYLAALQADVGALATVNINARRIRFSGVARAAGLLPKVDAVMPPQPVPGPAPGAPPQPDAWAQRVQEWVARVEGLARQFLIGDAEVDPKEGACDFCHAGSLCRIADRGLVTVQELEEHAALARQTQLAGPVD